MNIRTLKLLVEIDADNPPDWIWDSHKKQEALNGVCVKEIEDDTVSEKAAPFRSWYHPALTALKGEK